MEDEFGFSYDIFKGSDNTPESEPETDLPSEPDAGEPAQEQEEQNDTDTFDTVTDTDNEEDGEDEEEEPAVIKKQTAEENRNNAMRRRRQDAKREKDALIAEVNELLAEVGIKNPYGEENEAVDSVDKLRAYVASKRESNAVRSIKASGEISEEDRRAILEADPVYREAVAKAKRADEVAAKALLNSHYSQIKAFDPDAPALDELLDPSKNADLIDKASRLNNIYDAYRLVYGEEVRNRRAVNSARVQLQTAGTGKEHMRSTSTRGAGAPTLTQSDIAAYRAFDPDATEEEIRKYAEKDARTVKRNKSY